MAIIAPLVPTPAPTAPDRADRPTFSARATAWADFQKASLVPQMSALENNVYNNALEAFAAATLLSNNAAAAAASAASAAASAGATIWVSGSAYTIGNQRYSPINSRVYRRTTAGAGTMCAITGAAAGTGVGSFDVDGGYTTLVSPTMNLAGQTNIYVSYWRWYSNIAGGAPAADTMRVEISNNNGTTWANFETVGPTTQNSGGWINKTARLDAAGMPTLTSQMKMRFIADDAATGSVVEAALDDFLIYSLDCAPPCAADFNGDGTLDFFDYLDFVDAFSANNMSADFNGDGVLDFFDYLDFVDAFSAGC